MDLRQSLLLGILAGLFCSKAFAAAGSDPCLQLDSYGSVLDCALSRHPEMSAAELGIAQADKGKDLAAQRPNPELASQGILGGSRSGNYLAAEMNFAHTFELGGKRGARIQSAEADIKTARGQLVLASENIYLRTALALLRVRQIAEEWAAIDDALQTFSRIGKQYNSRPRLNPEQRASLRIFEIAAGDYKIRQSGLESERELRLRELELALGRRLPVDSPAFPERRTEWPALPALESSPGNAKAVLANADLEKARAELKRAEAEAWPDVKVGPTLYEQRQSGQGFQALGLNFSLPLPLYHRNEAGKAVAAIGVDRSESLRLLAERENELEKSYLKHRYESAVASFINLGSTRDLLRKHEETENLFAQGFLNGTVIVEIHRQVSDFMKSRNEQELSAEEALIRYYALAGRKPEVSRK